VKLRSHTVPHGADMFGRISSNPFVPSDKRSCSPSGRVVHVIATSSWWTQSCMAVPVKEQSLSAASVPLHITSSIQIGTSPGRVAPVVRHVALTTWAVVMTERHATRASAIAKPSPHTVPHAEALSGRTSKRPLNVSPSMRYSHARSGMMAVRTSRANNRAKDD
jgi:hypothetical protein